jgi:cell division protein FtsL
MNQSSLDTLNHTLMTISSLAVILFIFGIAACVIAIAYLIRLWLVQTATFQIQKDVADIRDHVLGLDIENEVPSTQRIVKNGYIEPLVTKSKIEFKKPRKIFLWVAITIPLLLICLVIILNLY